MYCVPHFVAYLHPSFHAMVMRFARCMRQTLQPNPDSREAMAAAFQRHAELGETLFGAKR